MKEICLRLKVANTVPLHGKQDKQLDRATQQTAKTVMAPNKNQGLQVT